MVNHISSKTKKKNNNNVLLLSARDLREISIFYCHYVAINVFYFVYLIVLSLRANIHTSVNEVIKEYAVEYRDN